MCGAAVGRCDRRREEVLELVDAARRRDILVRRDPAHRRFVHLDFVGDVAQDERPQMSDALGEKSALLRDDLRGHLDELAQAYRR